MFLSYVSGTIKAIDFHKTHPVSVIVFKLNQTVEFGTTCTFKFLALHGSKPQNITLPDSFCCKQEFVYNIHFNSRVLRLLTFLI